jgi:hypothetical protein
LLNPTTGKELRWRAQGDDFTTFLDDFVTDLPQIELPAELTMQPVLNSSNATTEDLPSKSRR